ncbi:MAG TPA: formate dehydrogenase subunit beta [Ilumatobacteraceae bacterium]|nr:formate dehydrogenase subunit beta [Ilumatobacteraceae bacterium]
MSTELGLNVRRKSATPSSGTNIRRDGLEVSKIVDIDLCIGCKACEVACKEWNDLAVDETFNFGSYQSHEDLTPATWDLMRFNEVDLPNGDLAWLIRKDSCLHCDEPGCLLACPAPGAIVQYENGIVDFDQSKCIGCQYCISGCPFDIPRFDSETKKVYKCTMCVDRVANSLEPACVKSCPTGAIKYGSRHDMITYGEEKVAKLQERGFANATLYNPSGVGGVHMMYVVPRGEMLGEYGLPGDPDVRGNTSLLGLLRNLRGIGAIATWAGLIGVGLYWLRTGRKFPPPENIAVADAIALGHETEPPAPAPDAPSAGPRDEGDET